MQSVAVASGRPVEVPGQDTAAALEFEEVVFVDPAAPFHGGPPPHIGTALATDFRLNMGGIRWFGTPKEVKYRVDAGACMNDYGSAVAGVTAGFDVWEFSDVTFTQDNGSPDSNPCTDSPNSGSWVSIDGPGGTLAQTSVCRNVATKEIVGFWIEFDSGDIWSDSGDDSKFDIQAVAAHEIGHIVGLGHVNSPHAISLSMFPRHATADKGPRTLGCGDLLVVDTELTWASCDTSSSESSTSLSRYQAETVSTARAATTTPTTTQTDTPVSSDSTGRLCCTRPCQLQ